MSEEKENVELWKSVENTDKRYMKEVSSPYKHISIDAQYQILTATRLWGPMGRDWGVRDENYQVVPVDTKNVASVIYTAILFYPDGGKVSINSDIFIYVKAKDTFKANNDYAKKVATDALTKGLSKLGFSADIFMGKYDGGKYDGIESFEPKEGMTAEQGAKLAKYIQEFEHTDIPRANWIKSEIAKGLSKDQAELVIKKIQEFKLRGSK